MFLTKRNDTEMVRSHASAQGTFTLDIAGMLIERKVTNNKNTTMSTSTYEQVRAEFDAEVKKAFDNRDSDKIRDLASQLPEDADEEHDTLLTIANNIDTYECFTCKDERGIEILGNGDNFECDVVGYKPCPDCEYEDPIQI